MKKLKKLTEFHIWQLAALNSTFFPKGKFWKIWIELKVKFCSSQSVDSNYKKIPQGPALKFQKNASPKHFSSRFINFCNKLNILKIVHERKGNLLSKETQFQG